ncbi:6-bladed beta-propeller [Parabacteroides bouchesdurhonensis]|uniref:6-bladed beta-propeller n=1 Tax=Parabacteroides bouchesdurhonensis TaxID=1936995 RepID=UPI000E4EACCD|nr:6-bladed beta-propeller [Parabacteroides bouchesdurhonensis]RHJ90835.1 6-bladed beta-propeller [Bacteroides sp. AM07-16]
MKRSFTIVVTILFVMAGCGGNKQSTNEVIIVDVTKNYPEKELILQDFMDVEYIPLEASDEFVTQGKVMAIGAEVLLITNWINDGNLFVFDRKTGKGLRKINRKGQGGEEYVGITEVVLDEANKEIFVIAYTGSKISVYDLDGNFKRSFKAEGTDSHVNTFNYDRKNLISYVPDNSLENPSNVIHPYYLIFSKQDGSITRKISIPFNEIKIPVAKEGEALALPVPTAVYQIIPDHASWVLMDTSSDTMYHYLPDTNMTVPIIVRTPSVHTMDPPELFLIPSVFTDRYYFMSLLKAEFNFAIGKGFPSSGLMYDRLENSVFIPKIYNGDYTSKREVYMMSRPLDPEFVIGQSLQAHELVEAYERGQLKGKLKEIAAKLDEESNPVIMLANMGT